jgi:CheY-like chemotaxis protein
MARVRLIVWNEEEAKARASELRALGHRVEAALPPDGTFMKALRRAPPDAMVIDLARQPSRGRDVAMAVRASKATRAVPLVFVGGEPGKVARYREQLPGAAFTAWRGLGAALKRALTAPPAHVSAPAHALAGYSGTPLPKKLGIKEGATVVLVGAPPGFEETLGALPAGARLVRAARAGGDLTLWFLTRRAELDRRIVPMAAEMGAGLWICWPKMASGVKTDLREPIVREVGLAHGIVDYKVCAVDPTWSGLKFARRK